MFFRIAWDEVNNEDYTFIIEQYFSNKQIELIPIRKYEYYTQCSAICSLFEYKLWNRSDEPLLYTHAVKALLRDIKPQFLTMKLVSYIQSEKIIRPGYTTLQT